MLWTVCVSHSPADEHLETATPATFRRTRVLDVERELLVRRAP